MWRLAVAAVVLIGYCHAQACRDRNATDSTGQGVVWQSDSFSLEHYRYLGCADMAGSADIEESVSTTLTDVVGNYLTTKTQTGSFLAALATAVLGAMGGVVAHLSNQCITAQGEQIFNKAQQSNLNLLVAPMSAAEACCAVRECN